MSFFEGKVVEFTYTNHRYNRAVRRVVPRYIWFGASQWHGPREQWFLRAVCLDRQEERDFQFSEIHDWAIATDQSLPWRS